MHTFEIASFTFQVTPARLGIFIIVALIIAAAFRFAFAGRRDQWFARTPSTVIHMRGAIGNWLSLGYPVSVQGYAVTVAIVCTIIIAGLFIFALPEHLL